MVTPEQLNYNNYATEKYDDEISRVIPGHARLHQIIEEIFHDSPGMQRVLELGIGTGLTAERILRIFPHAQYVGIDFSETMLAGAEERLKQYSHVQLQCGDYAHTEFPTNLDAVVSVIGIHHQETDDDKKRLFQKIYDSLSSQGIFVFGDLMTYKDPQTAALNDARHYHHLVAHARDEQSLREWAHHHKNLNESAALENQMQWLQEIGFKVELKFQQYNTVLLHTKKSHMP